jgi:hypothetical protein
MVVAVPDDCSPRLGEIAEFEQIAAELIEPGCDRMDVSVLETGAQETPIQVHDLGAGSNGVLDL